jgi:hypothetical protein
MEPIPDIFKGKCVCKCCVRKTGPKTDSKTGENIRLIIREKPEKKKLIINI